MFSRLSGSAVLWATLDVFGVVTAVVGTAAFLAPTAWWSVPVGLLLAGFVAAYRSPGVTVYEPGIAAALIVIGLATAGRLGAGAGLGMGLFCFGLAVIGAQLGERWQARVAPRTPPVRAASDAEAAPRGPETPKSPNER
jgi:hypothetical protein